MTRAPTSQAERYLDAARTLGVSDAALRRHLDVDAGESVQATLAGELSAPTDELLELLAAASVVLDLDAVEPEDAEPLRCCLARFGFVAECAAVAGELEIVAVDVVRDDVEHVRAEPATEPLGAALRERLFEPVGIRAVPLVDGRRLVAETRALARLQDRYGPRLEVFETPLLAPDVEPVAAAPGDGVAGAETAAASSADVGDGADAVAGDAGIDAGPAGERVAVDEDASFADVVAAADDKTASAIESALAEGGPRVHTSDDADDEVDDAADAGATQVGGGPRRTVSSSGIDEVFEQLEASAPDGAAADASSSGGAGGAVAAGNDAAPDASAGAGTDAPSASGSNAVAGSSGASGSDGTSASNGAQASDPSSASDAPSASEAPSSSGDAASDAAVDDADASSDEGPTIGGGPSRTVSETSADDILERLSEDEDDFEDLADEQGEADPEAVLDDAESLPEIDDDPDDDTDVREDRNAESDADVDSDDSESGADDGDATSATDAGDVGDDAGSSDDGTADDAEDATPDLAARVQDALDGESEGNADDEEDDGAGGVTDDELAQSASVEEPSTERSQERTTASDADDVEDAADALASSIGGDVGDAPSATSGSADDGESADETPEPTHQAGDSTASTADEPPTGGRESTATGGHGSTLTGDEDGASDGDSTSDDDATSAVDSTSDGPGGLGDALVGEDVEVRKGTETVATGADAVDVDRGSSAGRPSTDGPLARSVGAGSAGDDGGDAAAVEDADGDGATDADDAENDDSVSLLERVRSVFRR